MKLELNTNLIPFFSGTYYTMWEIYETDDDGNELEVNYNSNDFMQSIINAYKRQQPQILRDLKEAADFITNINFPGTSNSPREYNFGTDTIDFDLTINKTKLKQTIKKLESDPEFHKFLKDKYTSYDGFISFTPNNYQNLKEAIENNNDESDQAIGALIQYLTKNLNTLNKIEEYAYNYWQGNGYCGLDYEIINE